MTVTSCRPRRSTSADAGTRRLTATKPLDQLRARQPAPPTPPRKPATYDVYIPDQLAKVNVTMMMTAIGRDGPLLPRPTLNLNMTPATLPTFPLVDARTHTVRNRDGHQGLS